MFFPIRIEMNHRPPAASARAAHPGLVLLLAVLMLGLTGCPRSKPPAAPPQASLAFQPNRVYAAVLEKLIGEPLSEERIEEVQTALTERFGTAQKAAVNLPAGSDTERLFDTTRLEKGRVLFAEHCVVCHGAEGSGAGPRAAELDPYPRDYRRGIFKYKSTPIGSRPTDDDLRFVLRHGIVQTGMPAFESLSDEQVDDLIAYVKYLSIRGELERVLLEEAADLTENEKLDLSDETLEPWIEQIVGRWRQALEKVVAVPPRPAWSSPDNQESVELGRRLFYGETAGCAKCHDDEQLKKGLAEEYDDWAKELADWGSLSAEQHEKQLVRLAAAGGLPPRRIRSRNLQEGVYRGGGDPSVLYRRIVTGIEGISMPAAAMKTEGTSGQAVGMTSDDVWHLIDYVLALPRLKKTGPP